MGTRNGPVERARRRIDEDLLRARLELGTSRRAAGLSLEEVASTCNIAGSTASRTERGLIRDPDLRVLAALAATVGLELRLRIYPSGDPIRDAGQQRLVERLHLRLHASLGWRTEVPLPIAGDHRAWDAEIRTAAWRLVVEAETVVEDVQALERRIHLKQRDGGVEHVILLIADTRRNRRALASAPAALAGFSRNAREVLHALGSGEFPGTSALVLL
jgi:transcriptional regulator with XRE-family HTH domain